MTSSAKVTASSIELSPQDQYWRGQFKAMASPCEVLVDTTEMQVAQDISALVAQEVWRIEAKYSRFSEKSFLGKLNQNVSSVVTIDSESAKLFQFADACFKLSDGLFDITSGELSRIWRFDGGHTLPSQQQIQAALSALGWQHVKLTATTIEVPKPIQLDLGGIAKEYAADSALQLVRDCFPDSSVLINLGGDITVSGSRRDGCGWLIAIEHEASKSLQLQQGAVATSGTTKRFIMQHGKRYGHIINPKTGWPVNQAPLSVTVIADTCIQAGIYATLAMLQGADAESFLKEQGIAFHCIRD